MFYREDRYREEKIWIEGRDLGEERRTEKERGKWRMYNLEEKVEGRTLVRGRCDRVYIEEEVCEREVIGYNRYIGIRSYGMEDIGKGINIKVIL